MIAAVIIFLQPSFPTALEREKKPKRPNNTHPHGAFSPAAGTGIYNQNCLGHRPLLVLPAMLAGC